jgi:hypothetical protein
MVAILSTTFAELNADAKAEVGVHMADKLQLMGSSCLEVRSGYWKESRVCLPIIRLLY